MREVVLDTARLWLDNADLLRPIVHRAGTDAKLWRRGADQSRDHAARFRAILGRLTTEAEADACYRIVYASCVHRVMFGPDFESSIVVDDDTFAATLAEAAVRVLEL